MSGLLKSLQNGSPVAEAISGQWSWQIWVGLLAGVGSLGGVEWAIAYPTRTPWPLATEYAQVSPSPGPATVTRPVLQIGSQGSAVSEVQGVLALLGYYDGPVDGQYEVQTANAVANFQRAAGLAVDGVVGPVTWARLLPAVATTPTPAPTPAPSPAPTASPAPAPSPAPAASPTPTPSGQTAAVELPILRVGMQGPAIARLQDRLRALNLYSGAVDGVFGPATEAAVQSFQRSRNLTVDGVVGPATWAALLR